MTAIMINIKRRTIINLIRRRITTRMTKRHIIIRMKSNSTITIKKTISMKRMNTSIWKRNAKRRPIWSIKSNNCKAICTSTQMRYYSLSIKKNHTHFIDHLKLIELPIFKPTFYPNHSRRQQIQEIDKLDEYEENDILDDGMIGNKHDEDLEGMAGGYHSDEDIGLDDNKFKNQVTLSKQNSKKRHLTTQESISDTEFFNQRFDGPGLKNLNKQESIIEEEDIGYPVVDVPKPIVPRVSTTREVCEINENT